MGFTLSPPQTTSRLASLAEFFFFRPRRLFSPFFPNAEPGPRLLKDNPPNPGKVGHTTGRGICPLLFSNNGVGYFTSHKNHILSERVKVLWDGTYDFRPYLKRLESYLKSQSVGPVGIWTIDLS